MDYNTIQNLPYMDRFILEGTRAYGTVSLERMCLRDYKVPGTNVTIPKGMRVQVGESLWTSYIISSTLNPPLIRFPLRPS